MSTVTTYRTINTAQGVLGPFGVAYIHDAAKPFGVLKSHGQKEFCIGRFSTETKAKKFVKMRLSNLKFEAKQKEAA